jgi:Domain of unknown function (DUF1990)
VRDPVAGKSLRVSLTIAPTLRWPAGVLLTAWAYMWRTTPIWRENTDGAWPADGPPPFDGGVSREGIQRPEDGAGPLFRRRYRARIAGARASAEALMAAAQANPDAFAPGTLAHFRKRVGDDGVMRVGDDFVVHMPGPWNGPIRVVETTPASFRFATLDGHLEAGQIEWRAREEEGAVVFEIESWARGGDRVSSFLHDRLRMAKEVQLHMWTRVLERAAKRVDGRLERGIEIETRRVEL